MKILRNFVASSNSPPPDVELHVGCGLVAGEPQQQVLQRVDGQLAVGQVEVLQAQGHREELLESSRDFSCKRKWLLTKRCVSVDVTSK